MLHDHKINEIAERVARGQVDEAGLERVLAEPITDSEGNDALRITVVLKPETAQSLSGEAALDLLVELQRALQKEGEERFATVQYATEEELKADEPAESDHLEENEEPDDKDH